MHATPCSSSMLDCHHHTQHSLAISQQRGPCLLYTQDRSDAKQHTPGCDLMLWVCYEEGTTRMAMCVKTA